MPSELAGQMSTFRQRLMNVKCSTEEGGGGDHLATNLNNDPVSVT